MAFVRFILLFYLSVIYLLRAYFLRVKKILTNKLRRIENYEYKSILIPENISKCKNTKLRGMQCI